MDPRKIRFTTETHAGRRQHLIKEGTKTLYKGSAKDIDHAKVDLLLELVSQQQTLIDNLIKQGVGYHEAISELKDIVSLLKDQLKNAVFLEPLKD